MSRTTSSSSSSSDAFDELAAMFMTPADPGTHQPGQGESGEIRDGPAGSSSAPFTGLLLVGHLPVRGNLWLTPYADALAREIGPVAMIRHDSEQPTMEIMRGPEHWRSEIAGLSLREAIDFIADDIRAWIIRPDAAIDALSPNVIGSVDRLMLLSSADQAASVAAYQTIKRLKLEADAAGIDLPAIAMAIVGSQPESATWMVRRLQATATTQLGVSVVLDRVLPRIDSEACPSVYMRFTNEIVDGVSDVLTMIERAKAVKRGSDVHSAAAEAQHEPAPRRLTPSVTNGHHCVDDDGEREWPASAPALEPAAWDPIVRPAGANDRAYSGQGDGIAAASSPIKLTPKHAQRESYDETHAGASAASGKANDIGTGGMLAAHVPGLTPLEFRSPKSANVELAIDASGHLHLLAEETHLRDMRIVEAWAKSHRELLAIALPSDMAHPADGITCHLFTNEPSTVADLHGTEIKLHVLAPVDVEGRTGWYAAALNR